MLDLILLADCFESLGPTAGMDAEHVTTCNTLVKTETKVADLLRTRVEESLPAAGRQQIGRGGAAAMGGTRSNVESLLDVGSVVLPLRRAGPPLCQWKG